MGQDTRYMHDEYRQILQNQQQQQDWQAEQNQLDRDWQQSQWDYQFDKETDRWFNQFNAENEYNTPAAQAQRLAAAGLNPSVIMSQGQAGAGLSTAPPQSSKTPGVQGKSVTPPSPISLHSATNPAAMFSSIAQLNDSLSKMVKAGSDISVDQRKIAPVVENIISDTQNKQSNTYLTNTLNALKQAYGSSELTSSITKMLSESAALDAQGNLYGAQTAYYNALKHFTETQDFQKSDSYTQVLSNLKSYGDYLDSQAKLNRASAAVKPAEAEYYQSSANASDARARLDNALSSTEDALRNGKIREIDLSNIGRNLSNIYQRLDNDFARESYQDRLISIMWQAKREGYLTEEQLANARAAIKHADWYDVQKYFDLFGKSASSVGSVVVSAYPYSVPFKPLKK